jgi:hypothetical protein
MGRDQIGQASRSFLGRDAILNASDVQQEDIYVPEWGTWVHVRGLSGRERDGFEAEMVDQRGKSRATNLRNIRARLVALSVVDDAGQRMFQHADIDALGEKSARALDRIFGKAMELSGLRQQDVEEMAENFDETPGGGSSFA